ncbi:MAG: hypothetical protein ACREDR_26320, partial [Blastocatellia bacterium]
MSTNPTINTPESKPAGLVQLTSNQEKEEAIRRKVEEERARLARQMGIELQPKKHFEKPVEHPFTKDQREHTT